MSSSSLLLGRGRVRPAAGCAGAVVPRGTDLTRPLARHQVDNHRASQCRADVQSTRTPHCGFHLNTSGRFMEGWYFRVTDPDSGDSAAFIYSYEQGRQVDGTIGRIGAQIMGPGDGYIAQTTTDTSTWWADRNRLRLGACFEPTAGRTSSQVPRHVVPEAMFRDAVEHGFQATETLHQGCMVDDPGSCPGSLPASVPFVSWSFTVEPVYGWGDTGGPQRATAGWLATLPVLEPHWQVLMAHGLATGHIQWGHDKRMDFHNAPLYSEKNWGNGFPKRWAWVQCNSFDVKDVCVTGVFALRNLLGVPGLDEAVGLIGVHHNGRFIELTPANGEVSWDVAPWGKWLMRGKSAEFEAELEAECDDDAGAVLRAPLGEQGLAEACKDTFAGPPMIDASSTSAAAEVGGGPWWNRWTQEAKMNPAVAATMRTPVEAAAEQLRKLVPFDIPESFKPPGY